VVPLSYSCPPKRGYSVKLLPQTYYGSKNAIGIRSENEIPMDNFTGHDEGKRRQDRNDLTLLLLLSPQPKVRMFTVLQPVLNPVTVYEREDDGSQPQSQNHEKRPVVLRSDGLPLH
jgi:hypothetical protein